MAQNYTSDMYDINHTVSTDMGRIENSVNTLRTNFSGSTQPANPVAFQFWGQTSSSALMIRNSANNDWLKLFNLHNASVEKLNRTVTAGTALSGGGTLTSNLTISHAAHTGDVTGTQNLTIAAKSIGTKKFNSNAVIFYADHKESSGQTSYEDTHGPVPLVVPSGKGFLRLYLLGRRSGGGTWIASLRVGTQNSSGTGSQNNTTYSTSYFDCGMISLSTFSSGDVVEVSAQTDGQSGAQGFTKNACIVWGTST